MLSEKMKMKQPFKILIDVWGVMTSWDFIRELNNYLNNNISEYLLRNWDKYSIKDFVLRLRLQNEEDRQTNPDLPSIEDSNETNTNEVIQSVVDNINWRETNKLNTYSKDIKELNHSIWMEGYASKKLKVHIFDDVIPALEKWTSEDLGIKIYTFASGSPNNQKLFLSSTVVGDLNRFIVNGINSFHKYKKDSKKFGQIFSALLERQPQNILYLTDNPKKARAAIEAQLRAVVVLRNGNKKYSEEEFKDLQIITNLDQLDFIIAGTPEWMEDN